MFVGVADGTNSATIPSHQVGDLIIAFAFRGSSTTVPSTPSGQGWTDLASNGANSCALKVAFKYASSTSETTGTFNNAERFQVIVYRNMQVNQGTRQVNSGNNSAPSIWTLASPSAGSWALRYAGRRTATTINTLANHTVRSTVSGNPLVTIQDSGGPESSWSTKTWSTNTSSGWRTFACELIPTGPVATTPGPPALAVTAGNQQASLNWFAPDSDGGAEITGYVIQQSTAGGAYTTIDTVAASPRSYTATGLTNGVDYAFRVAAINSVGTGDWSAAIVVTPIGPPGAPTDLQADGQNNRVILSWTAPADTGGSPITDYLIEYRVAGGSWVTWNNFTSLWKSNFGGASPLASLGDGAAATVWDGKGNSSFSSHAGRSSWAIAVPANTRNGSKVRAKFTDLGFEPASLMRLEYDVFVPSSGDFALDFKLPGFASLPDGQSLWNASSGGSKAADSASIRIHARPAGQWGVPHPFLEAYAYAHSGGGKTWQDWGLYWRLSQSMNATGNYNGDEFEPPVGQWFHIAIEAGMNSPGQSNGTLKVWLDGQQGIGISDLVWVQAAPYLWTQTMFEIFYNEGSHPATTLRLANMEFLSVTESAPSIPNGFSGDQASFATGLANWNKTVNAANFTLSHSTDDGGSMRWLVTTASSIGASSSYHSGADRVPVVEGQTVRAAIDAKQVVGSGKGCRLRIQFYNNAGGQISDPQYDSMTNVTLTSTFQTIEREILAPAGAVFARLDAYVQGASAADDIRFKNAFLTGGQG